MSLRLLTVAALTVVAAVPAFSASEEVDALRGVEKVEGLLVRISAVQKELETLSASFEQRKESHLLAAPSVTRGTFYFRRPDQVRWEYREPRAMTSVLADGVALTYRPDEGRAERIEVGRMQRKVFGFLTATEPLDQLTRYFAVTLRDAGDDSNYVIELEPTAYQVKKRLAEVRVEFDRERYLPVAVAFVERDGDRTAYRFTDLRTDVPLDDSLFAIDLPPGVEVVEIKLGGGDRD